MGQASPRCKVEPKCDLGSGSARALFHPSFAMPKIKTTRTKKAPDGFEEIEPVGIVLLPM
jgi:hypothetical protein